MSTMVAAALIYSNDLTEGRWITAAALMRATYFIFRLSRDDRGLRKRMLQTGDQNEGKQC